MRKNVSVVIPAYNEEKTIRRVVKRLMRWNRVLEVIVVANGCTDNTISEARAAGARVVYTREKLGHDIGRAVGISRALGDIILVLDADIFWSIEEIQPFVQAVENGVDLALNQYPLRKHPRYHHPTAVAKTALNVFLGRKDLRAASLTTVPHALSRRAVGRLDIQDFGVPPVAQTKAVLRGLRVEAVANVPVGGRNPVRKHAKQVRDLIIGDCLEAAALIVKERGIRGGFTDYLRKREVLSQVKLANDKFDIPAVLAVVPTSDPKEDVDALLTQLERHSSCSAFCVVANGRDVRTDSLSTHEIPLFVDVFEEQLGHDVGRAVACLRYNAEVYLFTDADIAMHGRELDAYCQAISDGADVVLNDLDQVLALNSQRDSVSILKRFLNLSLRRPELGVASFTAVPHALASRAVEVIGAGQLAVPPLAHAIAITQGLNVVRTGAVDVVTRNRIRPETHSKQSGRPVEKMIVGDHLEALAYLQNKFGPRLDFEDSIRRRYVLKKL